MSQKYTILHHDKQSVQWTQINSGLASHVKSIPSKENPDLLVSGIREGVYYFKFCDLDDNGVPRYEKGRMIKELGEWAADIFPIQHPETKEWFLFSESGATVWKTDSDFLTFENPVDLDIKKHLNLDRYGRSMSAVSIFQRSSDAPFEMMIAVSDAYDYYPGEKGVYGGRSIGINQDGIDIGYDSQGNWLGGTPDADLYLFLLDFAGPVPKAEFTGMVRTENGPFRLKDSGGGLVVDDFDLDGHLEAVLLDDWKLKMYALSDTPGDTVLRPKAGNTQTAVLQTDFQYPWPSSVHLPGDAHPHLVMGCYSGQIYFAKNNYEKDGSFAKPSMLYCKDTEIRIGSFLVPEIGDWNGDGIPDMITGVEDGYLYMIENKGTKTIPKWGNPELLHVEGETFRFLSGETGNMQGPDERIHGYTCPVLYDWTGNGLLDLILGNITGYFLLLRNIGSKVQPRFAAPETFTVDGKPFRGEWRVRPAVADLDGDGVPELIFLDRQGMIERFPKAPGRNDTELLPGIRLVDNLGRWIRLDTISGGQGRVKLDACDWTENGTTDILVGTSSSTPLPHHANEGIPKGKSTFLILKNIGDVKNPVFMLKPLCYTDGSMVNLGTHSCSPTAADVNGDGKLEIISGNETGRLFYFENNLFAKA